MSFSGVSSQNIHLTLPLTLQYFDNCLYICFLFSLWFLDSVSFFLSSKLYNTICFGPISRKGIRTNWKSAETEPLDRSMCFPKYEYLQMLHSFCCVSQAVRENIHQGHLQFLNEIIFCSKTMTTTVSY